MKKKLLLLTVLVIALTCLFAISVSAAGVHDNVDKTQKVTLSDGTQVNLFDSEGNALIWYKDNSGTLQSIRADIGIEVILLLCFIKAKRTSAFYTIFCRMSRDFL